MQGTYPENVNLIEQKIKEKIFFYKIFNFLRKRAMINFSTKCFYRIFLT